MKTRTLYSVLSFFLILSTLNLLAQTTKSSYTFEDEISVLRFEKLSIQQGLSQSTVRDICQDKDGFMWFGTIDGLNKYDGYTFEVFKNLPENPHSITENRAVKLFAGKDGEVWIGTSKGLNVFQPEYNQFVSFVHDPDNPNSISDNDIYDIVQDKFGHIWVATNGGGLNQIILNTDIAKDSVLEPSDYKIVRYLHNPEDENSVSGNKVWSLCLDNDGMLWIGTDNVLDRYNPVTKQFKHYKHSPNNPAGFHGNTIWDIYADKQNNIWIATLSDGLNKYMPGIDGFEHYTTKNKLSSDAIYAIFQDRDNTMWVGCYNGLNRLNNDGKTFTTYTHSPIDQYSLSNDVVWSIFEDQAGILWIGTADGINRLDLENKRFYHIRNQPDNDNSLLNNNVWTFLEDKKEGVFWIGTSDGLDKFNPKTKTFTHYTAIRNDPKTLNNRNVWTLAQDPHNPDILWVGTWGGGLNKFNKKTETFKEFMTIENDSTSLSNNFVKTLFFDSENTLWVGTLVGLNKFNKEKGNFVRYMKDKDNPKAISDNFIYSFYEDSRNNFWVGTRRGGLNKMDRNTGQFVHYQHQPDNPKSLNNNTIRVIHEDKAGSFWIGTTGGLNLFDRDKEEVTKIYTERDGLPNNTIYGLLEDEYGNLWMSTNIGISKFDPKTRQFDNYDESDGLQSNEFNGGAFYKNSKGEMFFGGINGFNVFKPGEITDNSYRPPVKITDFLILNKSVPLGKAVDGRTILEKHISQTKNIVLSYKDYVFSFEFASLHYASPENNRYAYMMEGFDEDWNLSDANRRFATYTNLDPGDYVFKVKGTNCDGVWSEEVAGIAIEIEPPFWQTWWFRLLVAAFIIGSAVSFYIIRINIIKRQKRILEQQVKERTAEVVEKSEEIMAQRDELEQTNKVLEKQKAEISEKNKTLQIQTQKLSRQNDFIKGSIRYAKTIQNAILPIKSNMDNYFDSFIIFRPKDIVSGDFYWFTHIPESKNNKAKDLLAVIDCTGHGVPGAFMSMIGNRLLNEIVNERAIYDPAEILSRLNNEIIKALKQEHTDNNDGMDVCLCCLEKEKDNTAITYSGAKRPLIIHRKDNSEPEVIRGDRKSIGGLRSNIARDYRFTNHKTSLYDGDTAYLTSDGLIDQNGKDRRRFGTPRLLVLLSEIGNKPLQEQKQILVETLEKHQQDEMQRDDITFIGIRCGHVL